MKRTKLFILFFIVLVGIILRFWQFGSIPQGLQVDEAAFGYNAYSLLKTGKDEYGITLPVTLRSYNDQKAGLYAYVDAPFVAVMGLNIISVRILSAVLGVLFIMLAFFVTLELTEDENTSLIVAALCAISPTLIFQNRIQSDPTLGMFLVALGLYLFLVWIKRKNWILLCGSFMVWLLSLIAYQSPRVLLIVFLPFLGWHYRSSIGKKLWIILGIGYCVIILCVGILTISGGARYGQTSIFTVPEVSLVLQESIREAGKTLPIITRVFDNKAIYYGRALVNNYFSYLTPDFLFLQTQVPLRESVENTGILYLLELPFLLFGIYKIIKKRVRWGYFVLGWIALVPLVLAPFISESPNIHRFLLAILPLEIAVGFGITSYFEQIKNSKIMFKINLVLVPLLFIVSLSYFLNELFVHQPVHKPWNRNYPFQQLIPDLKKSEPQFTKIVVTNNVGNSYMFYLFFNQYDPKKYQESGSRGNDPISTLGKYEFVSSDCPFSATEGVLYVDDGMICPIPAQARLVEVINWGDNTPAFKLLEYVPQK